MLHPNQTTDFRKSKIQMMPSSRKENQIGALKKLSLGLVILFSTELYAQRDHDATKKNEAPLTEYGLFIKRAEEKLLSEKTAYPIILMNKDELDWRFLKARAFGTEMPARQKRERIIQNYVHEKTGLEISVADAANLETYAYILKDSAVALPLANAGTRNYRLCAVFPADPSSSRQLETERILGLGLKEAYGEIKFHNIVPKLSLEELALISIYHEIGHCLDSVFMPQVVEYADDPHSTHLSESFAETFALLALAREGRLTLAPARSLFRTIYSQKIGKFLASHPENSFGNPLYEYGGAIYNLAPSIESADQYIRNHHQRIQTMTNAELLKLAHDIVNISAPDSRVFQSIYTLLADGEEKALLKYERMGHEMPDLYGHVLEKLKTHIAKVKNDLELAFSLSTPEPQLPQLPQENLSQVAETVKNKKQTGFNQELDRIRKTLRSARADRDSALQLQSFVRELPEKLSK